MADYTIYVLDESDVTFLSGGPLDGENQGSGVHLTNTTTTFTVDTPAWTPIDITDNDLNFGDSDSSQKLNGAQEIDGTTYASGTVVEAEYGFEVEDEDGNIWQLIAFNVRESGSEFPVYGTVEGIAVIGGPGDFPPAGQVLTVISNQEGPNYAAADYATPICFDAGTPIRTPGGWAAVDALAPGDVVLTRDAGPQTVRWVGRRPVWGVGRFAPVEIPAGALGNTRTLRVSQQHRVLWRSPKAELMFGTTEVLVPAVSLVGRHGITLKQGVQATYCHILLDEHALLDAAGLWSESLYLGATGLGSLDAAARDEVLSLFPELERTAPRAIRPLLRRYEAQALVG
ncbi:MAG: Hint domain-containing protein [Pseudomonadota bacterium]